MGWIDELFKYMCGKNCATRDCVYVSKEGSRKAALYKYENKNC